MHFCIFFSLGSHEGMGACNPGRKFVPWTKPQGQLIMKHLEAFLITIIGHTRNKIVSKTDIDVDLQLVYVISSKKASTLLLLQSLTVDYTFAEPTYNMNHDTEKGGN